MIFSLIVVPLNQVSLTVLSLLADIRTLVTASDFRSLAYGYKLPVNGEGAKVAKNGYSISLSFG